MKIILICDNPEKWQECSIIPTSIDEPEQILVPTVGDDEKNYLYDVATEVKNKAPNSDRCIIVVDQFLACADDGFEWLQSNAGIALIKFLRMLDVRHHIVLITPFEPLDLIKQDHGNLIVSSKGISFCKYHYDFSEKTEDEIEALVTETFDEEQALEPYILADFRLPEDERHNWANWWGIVRLMDVHRAIFPEEILPEELTSKKLYPSDVDDKLESLESQQALHLFNQMKEFDIQKYSDSIGILNEVNRQSKFSKFNKKFQRYPNEKNAENETVASAHKKIIKNSRLAESVVSSYEILKPDILSLRFLDVGTKPNILYIDDNANNGWSEVFQTLIYNEHQDEAVFTAISHINNLDKLYVSIQKYIEEHEPELVLLDLRLKNESGTGLDVEELSGAQVLRKIRKDYPGLPVMMTTASNKLWSYKTLSSIGADAYWMKEGLDVTASFNKAEQSKYSIENYIECIRTVHTLCCDDGYILRRRYGNFISKLGSSDSPYWWERGSWIHPTRKKAERQEDQLNKVGNTKNRVIAQKELDKILLLCHASKHNHQKEIKKILTDTYDLFSSCLAFGALGDKHVNNGWYYPSLVIQQLGKVIEAVHGFSQPDISRDDSNARTMHLRNDCEGVKLFKLRNAASHLQGSKTEIDAKTMYEFVDRFLDYMETPPQDFHGRGITK